MSPSLTTLMLIKSTVLMLAVASVAAEGPDVALTNFNCQALVELVQATSHDDFKAMLDANNGNKVFALLYRLYEDCLKIMSVEKVGTGAGRKEGLDDESVGGGRELSNFVGRPASLIWRAQLARKRQKFSPRRPIML